MNFQPDNFEANIAKTTSEVETKRIEEQNQNNNMPSIFISKFQNERTLPKSKPKRSKKKPKKLRRAHVVDDTSDSDSNDDSSLMNNVLSLVTRSGSVLSKRQEVFDKFLRKELPKSSNSLECIMLCGKMRDTILYPCKHTLICRECWYLWKTYEGTTHRVSDNFDSDDEDNLTKPRCPYCMQPVDNSDDAFL